MYLIYILLSIGAKTKMYFLYTFLHLCSLKIRMEPLIFKEKMCNNFLLIATFAMSASFVDIVMICQQIPLLLTAQ